MSTTTTVTFGRRGFWAHRDPFAGWFAYLCEAIQTLVPVASPEDDAWLANCVEDWRVAAGVTDFGARVPPATDQQLHHLTVASSIARGRARAGGDLSLRQLRDWKMVDDLSVTGITDRDVPTLGASTWTLSAIWIEEVADAFDMLITGTLPPDPPEGAWFVRPGAGLDVMPSRRRYTPDEPRF